MRRLKALQRSPGFTLIELLFVVVLIGIMIAIAVPSFTSFISNYRATTAVNDLLQAITLTRTEALKRGRRVTLAPISNDWTQGWTVYIENSTASPPSWSAGEELIFRHDPLKSSTTISAPSGSTGIFNAVNYVAFDGTGYLQQLAGGSIKGGIVVTDQIASANANVRTLCLATFGRPRIVQAPDPCSDS